MKRAVSVSLGSSARDKQVVVNLKGEPISVERIGTDGDVPKAQRLFAELDGKVDALGVGGVDLYLRLDDRQYPLRAALKLVKDVHQTPVVDGRGLKHTLERRVFELATPVLAGPTATFYSCASICPMTSQAKPSSPTAPPLRTSSCCGRGACAR